MAYWKLVDGLYMALECSYCGHIAGALAIDLNLAICPHCHSIMGEKE